MLNGDDGCQLNILLGGEIGYLTYQTCLSFKLNFNCYCGSR